MKHFCVAATSLLCIAVFSPSVSAQPILKRVEEMLRNQIGGQQSTAATEPGYLGLIGDETTNSVGVQLLEVYPDQPAAQAGLATGDVITEIDGRRIRNMDDMLEALEGKGPGAKITVNFDRTGESGQRSVTLGRKPGEAISPTEEMPAPPDKSPPAKLPPGPRLGVRTIPVTIDVQRQNALASTEGAQVVSVSVDSAAARAGLPLGAVITAINGQPIRTPQELAATVRSATESQQKIQYVQSGRPLEVTAFLDLGDQQTGGPLVDTRAKPPQASPLAPAEVQPVQAGDPAAARIHELERRVQDLEARIKTLEAKASGG